MKKQFVIFWDSTYNEANTSKVVDLDFFGNHNGFIDEDQSAVERLDVGETTPMDSNHVWVMRVI